MSGVTCASDLPRSNRLVARLFVLQPLGAGYLSRIQMTHRPVASLAASCPSCLKQKRRLVQTPEKALALCRWLQLEAWSMN
jgi:hypothetical protein